MEQALLRGQLKNAVGRFLRRWTYLCLLSQFLGLLSCWPVAKLSSRQTLGINDCYMDMYELYFLLVTVTRDHQYFHLERNHFLSTTILLHLYNGPNQSQLTSQHHSFTWRTLMRIALMVLINSPFISSFSSKFVHHMIKGCK